MAKVYLPAPQFPPHIWMNQAVTVAVSRPQEVRGAGVSWGVLMFSRAYPDDDRMCVSYFSCCCNQTPDKNQPEVLFTRGSDESSHH